jgi:hypothetical protein
MNIVQRAFAGGEIAPALYARCDEVKYATGLRTMRNFLIMKHGGAANRPGTNFIQEVKDSSETVRLIPFEVSDDTNYVLEFGNQYFRVIKGDDYVYDLTSTITGIASSGTETVVTFTGAFFDNDVKLAGIVGMTQLNGRIFKIYDVTGTTFKIKYLDGTNVNSSTFPAYVSGGLVSEVFEQTNSPYITADLPLLKFTQSADLMTITHNNYAVGEISHFSDISWTYASAVFVPGMTAPTITGISNPGGGSSALPNTYVVTAVNAVTFEESLPSNSLQINDDAEAIAPNTVTFTAVTGAVSYNIYKLKGAGDGTFGFIGSASGVVFVDIGADPDLSDSAPFSRLPFTFPDNPGCCAYIQQRLTFGNQPSNTELVNMSRTGRFHNFTISLPSNSDDAVQFNLAGRKINPVKHILDLGTMVLFTANGEFAVNSNGSGPITPSNIVIAQQSYFGSSDVRPIIIGQNALFIQARGTVVRDLGYQFETQGYQGDDLSVFSAHLFETFNIVDWDYQQIPNSIVWAVRDDGVLLSLTYIKEQQIWGWARHDFQNNYQNGFVENVCCIPDGDEDGVYLTVRRTIGGRVTRYIEKYNTRQISNSVDCVFSDSTVTYDGRNTDITHSMFIEGPNGWTSEDLLIVSSVGEFVHDFTADDVGNGLIFTAADGTLIKFKITEFIDGATVHGFSNKDIPIDLQFNQTTNWAHAISKIGELWNMEGLNVSILGDGYVVASPNNDQYDLIQVTGGIARLGDFYSVIHVGLPFISDIETLDIDTPGQSSIGTYKKHISQVSAYVEKSRGFWAGPVAPEKDPTNTVKPVNPLLNLNEFKVRNLENYDEDIFLSTDVIDVNTASRYSRSGRVFIRQVDPLPLTILSVIPSGEMPIGGKQ